VEDLDPVRRFRRARVAPEPLGREDGEWLVGLSRPGRRPAFRAVRAPVRLEGAEVQLPGEARRLLAVRPGDRVSLIPLP
jgi:arginine/ornithine N-succinyltransferase beta subunit